VAAGLVLSNRRTVTVYLAELLALVGCSKPTAAMVGLLAFLVMAAQAVLEQH
jgi:hypothetical protein